MAALKIRLLVSLFQKRQLSKVNARHLLDDLASSYAHALDETVLVDPAFFETNFRRHYSLLVDPIWPISTSGRDSGIRADV